MSPGASGERRRPRVTPRGCLDDEAVLAFIEGQLTVDRAARVEDHLARCASCRRLLARLGRALAGSYSPMP